MWPRVVEMALGLVVLGAPDLLPGASSMEAAVTRVVGAVVLCLAGASFLRRFRSAHLGNLAVAAGLVAWGWLQTPRPASPWAQALILAGLLLGLVALVPAPATRPPRGWQRYTEEEVEGEDR